jgi:hypothetical protein
MQSGFREQVVPATVLNPSTPVVEKPDAAQPTEYTRGVARRTAEILDTIHQASGRGDWEEVLSQAERLRIVQGRHPAQSRCGA